MRLLHKLRVDVQSGFRQASAADRAFSAGCGIGITECLLEPGHEAATTMGVIPHDCGFLLPCVDQGVPFAVVVDPWFAGSDPFTAVFANGVIDGEDSEESFQSATADGGTGFQIDDTEWLSGKRVECAIGDVLIGDVGGGEVFPDAFIGAGGQQDGFGVFECAAGSTNLLVVGNGCGGRSDMQAETKIRFVVAHTQSGGGDDGFQLIAAQLLFDQQSIGRFHLSGIGGDVVATALQKVGQSIGFLHSECIDDA